MPRFVNGIIGERADIFLERLLCLLGTGTNFAVSPSRNWLRPGKTQEPRSLSKALASDEEKVALTVIKYEPQPRYVARATNAVGSISLAHPTTAQRWRDSTQAA
jgi:hypothetical protein